MNYTASLSTTSLVADMRGDADARDRQEARVLQLDPNFSPAYGFRANRFLLQGKLAEATAAYERARSLDPFSPGLMTSFAAHLAVTRHYDRALAVLLEVTEEFPEYQH